MKHANRPIGIIRDGYGATIGIGPTYMQGKREQSVVIARATTSSDDDDDNVYLQRLCDLWNADVQAVAAKKIASLAAHKENAMSKVNIVKRLRDLYSEVGVPPVVLEAADLIDQCRAQGFLDEQGQVRKVLGTLPITVEGDVIGDNCVVWRADANHVAMNRPPFYELHVGDTRTKRPSHSTRAAALAAQGKEKQA